MEEDRMVVVTTGKDRGGVFYGKLVSEKGDVVELQEAKMAVSWSSDIKGVLGLAATGPLDGCRISPAIPKIKLNGVTSIMDCTDAAIENWRKKTWS